MIILILIMISSTETTARSFDMAREFKETAHLKTDLEKYGDNYERIFRKEVSEHKFYVGGDGLYCETETTQEEITYQQIKEIARRAYQELSVGQDTEGFPESSSFIYGFIEGYKKAKEEN